MRQIHIFCNQAIICHDIVPLFLKIYSDLQEICSFARKIVFVILSEQFTTETITKTTLWANATNFLQICANLQKYWKIAMSNDGSSIEIIDHSHGQ